MTNKEKEDLARKARTKKNMEWKAKNKDKVKISSRRYYLKHRKEIMKKHKAYREKGSNLKRYGISLDEYNKMLQDQKNVCAICGQKETATSKGKIRKLAVDHCHNTKIIRGLLCNACNRGLGYFRDNQELLKNAYKYLNNYNEN